MEISKDEEQYDSLADAISSAIEETGYKKDFTEEEKDIVRESRDRDISEDIAQGLADVVDKLIQTSGKVVDYAADKVGVQTIASDLEVKSKERLEKSKKRKQLLEESQVGGMANSLTESLVEPIIETAALWRMGIKGEGVAAIPETATVWGSTEYTVRRALGDTHEQALDSAIVAGSLGGTFGAVASGGKQVFKFMDEAEEEMAKQAGGGTPPKAEPEYDSDGYKIPDQTEEFKYFDKEFVEDTLASRDKADETRILREDADVETTYARAGKDSELDIELKTIQDTFNKLDESPELSVYNANKELFEGVDFNQAKSMFDSNPKLLDTLKSDIETALFKRMDEIEFVKHGDDRIEVGAKSDLYNLPEPDSTKAEELAIAIKQERIQLKNKADEVLSKSQKVRQADYGKLLKEADEALGRYNASKTPEEFEFTSAELQTALKRVEPYRQEGIKRGEIDFLDGYIETGETASKKDLDIPAPPQKDTVKVGSTLWKEKQKKITEQNKINDAILEESRLEWEQRNKDRLNRIDKNIEEGNKQLEEDWFTDEQYSSMSKSDENKIKFIKSSASKGKKLTTEQKELISKTHKKLDRDLISKGEVSESLEFQKAIDDSIDDIVPPRDNAVDDGVRDTDLYKDGISKREIDESNQYSKKLDDAIEEAIENYEIPKNFEDDVKAFQDEVDNLSKKFENFFADVSKTKAADSYRELHKSSKKAFDSASRFKSVVQKKVYEATKDMPEGYSEKMYKHLLRTDYRAIQDVKTKKDANRFIASNFGIYSKAKKEIEILAKSMKDEIHMNSVDWRGNGFAIAKKLGLDVKHSDTIEKLVSIRAMDDADWAFVQESRGNKPFNLAMDLMAYRDKMSGKLFKDKPYNRIKGYTAEILSNTANEFSYKRGAIPPEMQTKIKGSNIVMKKKYWSDKDLLEYAQMNDMGLILNADGLAIGARKVAGEKYRVESLGKLYDFGEVMGETLAASVRKQNINSYFMKKIDEVLSDKSNGLLNGKGKAFRNLTDKEISMLPKQLRGRIQTINKELAGATLGNMEVHIATANQSFITAQLLTKDLVRMFKENVVLKNPVSYVNNFVFNYSVALQNGISPKRMFKYQKEAIANYDKMRKSQEDMIGALISNDIVRYKKLIEEAKSNDLYMLHGEGLAMSVISDITSAPTYSNRITDKILKKLVTDLFGKKKGESISNATAEIYLNPNARTGKFLLDTFTKIDVFGRYAIAKDAIEKGATIKEAVNKSNGIFGDLDKLSPMWVQGITEFGAVPFGNWFYRIAGGMGTNIKNNLGKAVALGVGLYVAQDLLDKRTESYNPMLTILNTPMDMVTMSPYLNISNIPETLMTPEVYDKIGSGDATKLVVSDAY